MRQELGFGGSARSGIAAHDSNRKNRSGVALVLAAKIERNVLMSPRRGPAV
jgi:hypothetical protein